VPEPEQVAVLVVLRAGTPETEAAMLRSAMRLWPQVVDVRPVSRDNRQAIADARARGEVVDELSPIFDGLRREILGALDAATGDFETVAATEPAHDPVKVAEQQERRPSPTPRAGS
jgi:hypothetical protein